MSAQNLHPVWRALALVLALLAAAGVARAADQLSQAVGQPLLAAQKSIGAHDYRGALNAVAQAEKLARTDYEKFIVAQMKGAALAGAGDAVAAAGVFEQLLASGRLSADEQLRMTEAVATTYLRAKNYPKAITWLERYRAAGGRKAEILGLRAQAYYQSGDYARAAAQAAADAAAAEQAGHAPDEQTLKLLAAALQKQHDDAGYRRALEQLVRYHPSRAYWAELIQRSTALPGYDRDLDLDRYRLLRASGNLVEASGWMEMAQLAVQAGYPGEAQALVAEAYAKKIFGVGEKTVTERQARLKSLIERKVAEDRAALSAAAGATGGDALVADGLAYVSYGDAATGLPMIERGIAAGGLKSLPLAQLHRGYAYVLAGDRARALAAFRAVQGDAGAAGFARLWVLLLQQQGRG